MVTLVASKPTTFGLWLEGEIYTRWPDKKEFAELADVTETAIGNWINHGAKPYRKTCYAIARALGIPANEVLERADYQTDAEPTRIPRIAPYVPEGGIDPELIPEIVEFALRKQRERDERRRKEAEEGS